jgi:hypothetical protein
LKLGALEFLVKSETTPAHLAETLERLSKEPTVTP